MKSINSFIIEKLKLDKNINVSDFDNNKLPKKNTTAYDYNGDPWTIIDFCQIIDNTKELNQFIKKYDNSGVFWEWYNDEFLDPDYGYEDVDSLYAVACQYEGDSYALPSDISLWVWGPEGVCYENK